MLRTLLCTVAPSLAAADWRTVTFDAPTPEPGFNQAKRPVISGGMPIGNGETVALVFPVSQPFRSAPYFNLSEGVHLWLSMATAMALDQSLMPLGVVSIQTDPPLGQESFSQTLFLENATVQISTAVGSVSAWVDATSNRVVASVRGKDGSRLAVRVSVQSLRPPARFNYSNRCSLPTSAPDEWSRPAGSDSVGLSHRNSDEDIALLGRPGAFNATLAQQGLGSFAERLQSSDRWRHRQFGLVASAEGLWAQPSLPGVLASSEPRGSFDVVVTTLAKQTASSEDWAREAAALHGDRAATATSEARGRHDAFWADFWNQSHIWLTGEGQLADKLQTLTERYAQTRYLQAIQAGTWVPIKFNGMLFTAQLPPEFGSSGQVHYGPNYRDWGAANWWQNTRLAYWNMFASADFDRMRTLFDYYLQMLDFLEVRTKVAFNHTGIYTTETSTLFGAYDPCDYGKDAALRNATDLNFGYEETPWIRFDMGGDAGLPELCVMLLDYYSYTLDDEALRQYLPLLSGTLDFFSKHYGDVTQGGSLRIFPTQALETYWCDKLPPTPDSCPVNDHPTVAALHVLTERALELPVSITSAQQRAQWRALRAALPPVPLVTENGTTVVSPYEQYPAAQKMKNVETPELYSTHPFRYFTLARSRLAGERGRDIAPSVFCLEESRRQTCRNADQNTGWTQGVVNAALLGRAKKAAGMTLERALVKPAIGYRFPGFAGHYQDYEPSEDHYANMNTALQLMLLSPGDDGLESGGALLFPAWPCEWDVDFRLAAPRRTTVSGKLIKGDLTELLVDPPERRAAITVLPCQKQSSTGSTVTFV